LTLRIKGRLRQAARVSRPDSKAPFSWSEFWQQYPSS
jgi:hypothetical protein